MSNSLPVQNARLNHSAKRSDHPRLAERLASGAITPDDPIWRGKQSTLVRPRMEGVNEPQGFVLMLLFCLHLTCPGVVATLLLRDQDVDFPLLTIGEAKSRCIMTSLRGQPIGFPSSVCKALPFEPLTGSIRDVIR